MKQLYQVKPGCYYEHNGISHGEGALIEKCGELSQADADRLTPCGDPVPENEPQSPAEGQEG